MISHYTLRCRLKKWVLKGSTSFEASRLHPQRVLLQRANARSIDYIEAHMLSTAIGFATEKDLLSYCLDAAPAQGAYLEFGVYKGGSLRFMAQTKPHIRFHGFDSFEGLPEPWTGYCLGKGAFSLRGHLPKMPGNVTLHKGWFDQVLPDWRTHHPENIAFLHVDCDIYASTVTVLHQLADRLQPDSILLFDEYLGYPNWENHEFKAWQEFVARYRVQYEYIAFGREQVAVRITAIGGDKGAAGQ